MFCQCELASVPLRCFAHNGMVKSDVGGNLEYIKFGFIKGSSDAELNAAENSVLNVVKITAQVIFKMCGFFSLHGLFFVVCLRKLGFLFQTGDFEHGSVLRVVIVKDINAQ